MLEAQLCSGLKPTRLAKLIGVEFTTWRSWVRPDKENRKTPKLENIIAVAKRTGYHPLDIIRDEEIEGWTPPQSRVEPEAVHASLQRLRANLRERGEEIPDEDFVWLAGIDMKGRDPTEQDYLWLWQGRRSMRRTNEEDAATVTAEESALARGGRRLR